MKLKRLIPSNINLLSPLFHLLLKITGFIASIFTLFFFGLISPFVKIKVGGMVAQRIGHLALNTDLFFRRQQIFGKPKRTFYIFIAGSVANHQLMKMWKRQITILQNRLIRRWFHETEWLWKKTNFYQPLEMNTNEYFEYQVAKPTITFTAEEEERGKQNLRSMGLNPDKDWFVSVFARDSEYLKKNFGHQKDWSYHDFRNADIDTFQLAIQAIVDRGGYVFRMGQNVNKALAFKHEKVIDYALTHRDDFMDVYLTAKCRFFLGTTSGICDLAMIFDVPRITTNAAPPMDAPKGKNCLFIPKKIKRRGQNEYVSYKEIIQKTIQESSPILWNGKNFFEAGYEYENNSPQEILEVTLEMIERLEGTFQSSAKDHALLEDYFRLFPSNHWAAPIKTPIGRKFLNTHQSLFFETVSSERIEKSIAI